MRYRTSSCKKCWRTSDTIARHYRVKATPPPLSNERRPSTVLHCTVCRAWRRNSLIVVCCLSSSKTGRSKQREEEMRDGGAYRLLSRRRHNENEWENVVWMREKRWEVNGVGTADCWAESDWLELSEFYPTSVARFSDSVAHLQPEQRRAVPVVRLDNSLCPSILPTA